MATRLATNVTIAMLDGVVSLTLSATIRKMFAR
jgi:hypothetical protein